MAESEVKVEVYTPYIEWDYRCHNPYSSGQYSKQNLINVDNNKHNNNKKNKSRISRIYSMYI